MVQEMSLTQRTLFPAHSFVSVNMVWHFVIVPDIFHEFY
jgi:phenylalanine-4-hydroxylase